MTAFIVVNLLVIIAFGGLTIELIRKAMIQGIGVFEFIILLFCLVIVIFSVGQIV